MILVRDENVILQFTVTAEILQSMNKVLPFVKIIKFHQSYLGLAIHVDCDGFSISKTNIPITSHFLYTVLYEKFHFLNRDRFSFESNFLPVENIDEKLLENISPDILKRIFEGEIGYNYDINSIFLNSKNDLSIGLRINMAAFEIYDLIGEAVQKSRYQYKLELNGHNAGIKLGNQLSWQCSCDKDCVYLVALLIILLEDNNYE